MKTSIGRSQLDGATQGHNLSQVHTREECSCRPSESPRLGFFHKMLFFFFFPRHKVYSRPHINLFAARANTKLPLYVSPIPDPLAWKQDDIQHWGTNLNIYAFLPLPLLTGVVKSDAFNKFFLDSRTSTLATKGVVHRSSGGRTSWIPHAVEPAGSASHQEVSQETELLCIHAWRLSKQLVYKAGFSEEVEEIVATDLRRSTACLYQGKSSRFLHWYHWQNIAPCKGTVLQIAEFFLYLCRELKLPEPMIKGCRSVLNHVLSLASTDMAVNRSLAGCLVASRNYSCLGRSHHHNGTCFWFLRALLVRLVNVWNCSQMSTWPGRLAFS